MGKYDLQNALVDVKKIYPTQEDKEAMSLLLLDKIDVKLDSIKGILTFFLVMFILGLIVVLFQGCMP